MSLSNEKIKKLIKEKNKELEDSINNMEVNMIDETDFDKGKALFYLGRTQSIYSELQALLKNQGIL